MSDDQFWRIVIGGSVIAAVPMIKSWVSKRISEWRSKRGPVRR